MKKTMLLILLVSCGQIIFAQQKYMTKEGKISFFSHTVVEDISAENGRVAGIINSENGEVIITLTMTDFEFEKKLMEEHFNENYVESEKFPKATFKGFIKNNSEVNYNKPGVYKVQVEGDMDIHGKKNKVLVDGSIEVIEGKIISRTKFLLNPEDYGIKIPKLVRKNIAEELEISADLKYNPL